MQLIKQVVRFIAVGGLSTVVDFTVYMLLSSQLNITVSKAISIIFASVISYILSKNWTFKSHDLNNSVYILKFYVALLINFTTNICVNKVICDISNMKIFAFVIATMCGTTVNFVLQRYWVFKKS